jgi:hypothetical protein
MSAAMSVFAAFGHETLAIEPQIVLVDLLASLLAFAEE